MIKKINAYELPDGQIVKTKAEAERVLSADRLQSIIDELYEFAEKNSESDWAPIHHTVWELAQDWDMDAIIKLIKELIAHKPIAAQLKKMF